MDRRSEKKKIINIRQCIICHKDIKRNTKQGEKRIRVSQYLKAIYCSRKCKGIGHSGIMMGENNPRWDGGKSKINNIIRGSVRYKKWRTKIFLRDKWSCQKCSDRGGNLEAHHIESFNNNIKLIFNINNGVTLCSNCHKKFHNKYGKGNNNLEQFLSFIK